MALYKNPYYDPNKEHHTPTGFRNYKSLKITKTAFQRWQRERHRTGRPVLPKKGYEAFIEKWYQKADFSVKGDAVWWLGHSSVLLRLGDLHVLTDPIFSTRTSPVGFVGPRRKTPSPAMVEDLPHIDVVVISHNHYDHLDANTINRLISASNNTLFLVPLGLKKWMKNLGGINVEELDWWESTKLKDLTLTFVPAQHWSRRSVKDTNRTLWGGWVISYKDKNVYFAGDTAYSRHLAEIGEKFPIDLALMPIGAYEPRWFMKSMHVDPAEAVQLHRELKCRRSLAIHWATFELADEMIDEPPVLLKKACLEQGVAEKDFPVIRIGAHIMLEDL